MSRNPISYILNLGKHRPSILRPLRKLDIEVVDASALLAIPLKTRKSPVKIEQVQHSNQMSS